MVVEQHSRERISQAGAEASLHAMSPYQEAISFLCSQQAEDPRASIL